MLDPWKTIELPKSTAAIQAHRVDADAPWGFFWARDLDGRCLLVLTHGKESTPTGRLPVLQGIQVTTLEGDTSENSILSLKLLSSEQRDIFHRLCLDIIHGAAQARSEENAVRIAVARMWRWHHLLRGGGIDRLSLQEQKGLIGELLLLKTLLFNTVGYTDAIASWLGPIGAPKDFEIDGVCIESKARRGGAVPHVAISSEHQLDHSGCGELFLHVVNIDRASEEQPAAESLTDVARDVRQVLESESPDAIESYESMLSAAGFRWEDDYSGERWLVGSRNFYRVTGAFPRLTASEVPEGLTRLRYAIDLSRCDPFRVDEARLVAALSQGPA